MGTKTSDNSITPILLRGFTGYSTSSISSTALEGSLVVGNNMVPATANMNSSCVGETETLDKNFNPGYSKNGFTISHTGLLESPCNMRSENENAANSLGGEVYIGGGERMTLDFLGVEPTGQMVHRRTTATPHYFSSFVLGFLEFLFPFTKTYFSFTKNIPFIFFLKF